MKFNRPHLVVIGLLCFLGIFLGGIAIGNAGTILQSITVDFYTVKKIIIDDVDKTPPADKRPFVYNGTTYVPLRYVAEALGKPVKWDGATGTIYIGKSPGLIEQKVIYDDFSQPLSVNWIMDKKSWSDAGTWSIDQNNGAYCVYNEGYLRLDNDKYYIGENYTIECEVALSGSGGMAGVIAKTDKDKIESYVDYYSDRKIIRLTERYLDCHDRTIPLNTEIGKYYKLKVSVRGKKVDIYLNNKYMTSTELKDGKKNLVGLYSYEVQPSSSGPPSFGYIRNFKIIME